MSVTTCGAGEEEGGTGGGGGPSRDNPFGLRSGTDIPVLDLATSVCGGTGGVGFSTGGVIATELDAGLRSGGEGTSTAMVSGFRSGVGMAPVLVAVSAAGDGEGAGGVACSAVCVVGVSGAGACSATGEACVAARSGLRSGRVGFTSALATTFDARAGLAAVERGDFATATAEATHANEANSKMCARMRFISSIGYRLRSCEKQVRTSPEPGSRDDDGTVVCRI